MLRDIFKKYSTDRFTFRPLEKADLRKGFQDLLKQLTKAQILTQQIFEKRYNSIFEDEADRSYHIVVIEDVQKSKIVGSGTVFLQKKFIRNTGLVILSTYLQCGHVEDIVVLKEMRGFKFGLRIIQVLIDICDFYDCYKITLDCADRNIKFYERCGFKRKEVQMTRYNNRVVENKLIPKL